MLSQTSMTTNRVGFSWLWRSWQDRQPVDDAMVGTICVKNARSASDFPSFALNSLIRVTLIATSGFVAFKPSTAALIKVDLVANSQHGQSSLPRPQALPHIALRLSPPRALRGCGLPPYVLCP